MTLSEAGEWSYKAVDASYGLRRLMPMDLSGRYFC